MGVVEEMYNSFEIDRDKVDFNVLYKIVKINTNIVTFRKYDIRRSLFNGNKEIVQLGNVIGDETYEVTPEVNLELVGKVGCIIKRFDGKLKNKKRKKLVVDSIEFIE